MPGPEGGQPVVRARRWLLGIAAVLLLALAVGRCHEPEPRSPPATSAAPGSPAPAQPPPAPLTAAVPVPPPPRPATAEEVMVEGHVVEVKTWAPVETTVTLESERAEQRTLTSDATGGFTTRLPSGAWRVVAAAGDFVPSSKLAELFVMSGAAMHGVHLHLARAEWFRGTVTDDDGRPLADVLIDDVRSDAEGAFALRSASKPGSLQVSHPCCKPGHRWSHAGDRLALRLTRWKPPPVGHVTGEVVDLEGRPCLALLTLADPPPERPSLMLSTTPTGTFTLPLFARGSRVTAQAGGRTIESDPLHPGEHVRLVVACHEGHEEPEAPELSGRLIDEAGRPWTECSMEVHLQRMWFSSADGRFSIRLPRDYHRVTFRCVGTTASTFKAVGLIDGSVALGDVVLERGLDQLVGTVIDRQTRVGIARAVISHGDRDEVSAITDARGAFTLALNPRPAELRASASGYLPLELSLRGDVTSLTIDLAPGAGDGGAREEYEGIGVGLDPRREAGRFRFTVTNVHPSGPAAEAGLREHDEVLAVDDLPASDFEPRALYARIRGPGGTWVKLALRRDGRVFDLRIQRRRVDR